MCLLLIIYVKLFYYRLNILILEPKFSIVIIFLDFLPYFQRFCSLTFWVPFLGLHFRVALFGRAFLALHSTGEVQCYTFRAGICLHFSKSSVALKCNPKSATLKCNPSYRSARRRNQLIIEFLYTCTVKCTRIEFLYIFPWKRTRILFLYILDLKCTRILFLYTWSMKILAL